MSLSPQKSDRVLDRRYKRRAHASDRRYHERVRLDVLINRFLNGQPYMCRMVDISRTGARLVPMIEPAADQVPTSMGLQFQLPDREDILTASGQAVTRDGRTVGVRFTNLPPDAAWAIESFLSFNAPQPG
jgi:hypothetical protein